jgi:hypothetical protein
MTEIFVFGSNLAGRHGAGAALEALNRWSAKIGVGRGRTGYAYAIPTKDHSIRTLPLHVIERYVKEFLGLRAQEQRPDVQSDTDRHRTGWIPTQRDRTDVPRGAEELPDANPVGAISGLTFDLLECK